MFVFKSAPSSVTRFWGSAYLSAYSAYSVYGAYVFVTALQFDSPSRQLGHGFLDYID